MINVTIARVVQKINLFEAQWFAQWSCCGDAILPADFLYRIGIPHPETTIDTSATPPFHTHTPDDLPLSTKQKRTIEQIFISKYGTALSCNFALYGGYFSDDWGISQGFNEPLGTWILGGNTNYILFNAPLEQSLFTAIENKWAQAYFTELNHLWPLDHKWFISSPPDTSYTIIGTNEHSLSKTLENADIGALAF